MQMWASMLTVFCYNDANGPADAYNFNYQNESTKTVYDPTISTTP